MTRKNGLWASLMFAAIAAACQSAPQKQTTAAAVQQDTARQTTQVAAARFKNETLQTVLASYEQLRDALVQGNVLEIKRAALALQEVVKQLPQLKQQQVLLTEMLQTGDIEKQRSSFALFNDAFIALATQQGLQKGTLYIAHCPMAVREKGAYWLTTRKEVVNPYYGNTMLHCGSIEKTIQ